MFGDHLASLGHNVEQSPWPSACSLAAACYRPAYSSAETKSMLFREIPHGIPAALLVLPGTSGAAFLRPEAVSPNTQVKALAE